MPTFTIDLPDNLNIPADWDAQSFVLTKIHESGMFSLGRGAQEDDDDIEIEDDPDSWFTIEERKQFVRNRRRLEKEFEKNRKTDAEHEEYYQFILNFPVADEEEIQALEEIQEMRQRWVSPW